MASSNMPGRLRLRPTTAIVLVQFTILWLLALLAFWYSLASPRADSLIRVISGILIVVFVWSLWSWRVITKSLFDPYVFFMIAAALFNGGQAMLEVFALNENGILDGRFSSEVLLSSLFLVTVGLASTHLGALLGAALGSTAPAKKVASQSTTDATAQRMRLVAWGLLLLSFIPALYTLRDAAELVMASGYSALYGRTVATGFGATPRVLAAFLLPGACFLLAGSKGRRGNIIISAAVILTYSAIQFFLGTRSAAIMPLLAYAWLWHRWIHPLPGTVLIAAGTGILFVLFPLVKVTRAIPGEQRSSLTDLMSAFFSMQHHPVIAIFREMGGSLMTVGYTLELVPWSRGFDLGMSYLYSFLTILPNLFWTIHPTAARGLAAHWLVQTIAPAVAARGGGYGFSFIAEAYLNFGWVGTPILLALIGFLLARFVLWAQRSGEPARLATVASFSSFFLIYARSESGAIMRSLFWYALLPYALVHLFRHLKQVRA